MKSSSEVNLDKCVSQDQITTPEELEVNYAVQPDALCEHEGYLQKTVHALHQSGIYILPNIFTTASIFAGFFSIISALQEEYEVASMAIFFALIFDIVDGRIARLTHTESKFGAEYDSLADLVSFGLAPALVMFSWAFEPLGKLGWSAAFIYLSCTALRLARFNSRLENQNNGHFIGLASPAAACIVASTVWFCHDVAWTGGELPHHVSVTIAIISVTLGFLMIANFRYYSFKRLDFHKHAAPLVAAACFVAMGVFYLGLPLLVLLLSIFYALSGPVSQFLSWRRREDSHFGY